MKSTLIGMCLLLSNLVIAQSDDNLFGPSNAPKPRKGLIINANGQFDVPAGDMAKRFGLSYRLGPAIMYKTFSNFLFGAKFDFISGGKVLEDSLMINIRDKYSTKNTRLYEFINASGQRIGVPVYERGYAVGLCFGKIFSFSKQHPDNGLTVLGSAGFIQHKINIFDKDKTVPQLRGNYRKGYDRLTNGGYGEVFLGYTYFAKGGMLNFTIGFDVLVGVTQGRRDYLYDVMRSGRDNRIDVLYGIRGGWYIPIFRRKSEDMMFE